MLHESDSTNRAAINCVLFDLYGTLVDIWLDEDSAELWAGLCETLKGTGAALGPDEMRRQFRHILSEEVERGREGFIMETVFTRLAAWLKIDRDVEALGGLFRRLSTKSLTLRPYVAPLFAVLRRSNTKLGIVSNTEAVLTRYDLDRFPLLLTVDTAVLSSDVGLRKPDARIFRLALDRLQAVPGASVHVGNDWTADVVGALEAGLSAIYLDARLSGEIPANGRHVCRAAPTFESIASALRASGWSSV